MPAEHDIFVSVARRRQNGEDPAVEFLFRACKKDRVTGIVKLHDPHGPVCALTPTSATHAGFDQNYRMSFRQGQSFKPKILQPIAYWIYSVASPAVHALPAFEQFDYNFTLTFTYFYLLNMFSSSIAPHVLPQLVLLYVSSRVARLQHKGDCKQIMMQHKQNQRVPLLRPRTPLLLYATTRILPAHPLARVALNAQRAARGLPSPGPGRLMINGSGVRQSTIIDITQKLFLKLSAAACA